MDLSELQLWRNMYSLKYYYFFVQILKGSVTPGSLTGLRRTLTTSYTQLVGGMWGAVATMEDAEVY